MYALNLTGKSLNQHTKAFNIEFIKFLIESIKVVFKHTLFEVFFQLTPNVSVLDHVRQRLGGQQKLLKASLIHLVPSKTLGATTLDHPNAQIAKAQFNSNSLHLT